ncbi:helix-turn-helix domain-containing protein [Paucilactobacillus wasatchensis]|uniref:Mobile element protein n=1 Tax=Paucilactobacillus wasatchensis TaxID=1335616 RepID=A0A0D0Y4Z4_9LACO|nr:helix-turn-helix domain-containing protein [Paucilactobacillus wasatchensis]KIS03358.1 Mobile element protein [Paucilactobacillus wasatchensis]
MGRKGSRYSVEEKVFYIKLVQGGMSAKAIRHEYGVHNSQVAQWIERYNAGGIDALRSQHQQRVYSKELMLEVVQAYLAGSTSYPQLARQYDISNGSVIYQWVKRYTSGKPLTTTRRTTPMKDGRKTTQVERIEIAQWVIANGMNYTAATTQFNVSYGQVYSWVKKIKQGGPEGLADRRGKAKEDNGQLTELELKDLEIKRLRARLSNVSTEVAVLKKLQELERMDVLAKKNMSPFKRSHKK